MIYCKRGIFMCLEISVPGFDLGYLNNVLLCYLYTETSCCTRFIGCFSELRWFLLKGPPLSNYATVTVYYENHFISILF